MERRVLALGLLVACATMSCSASDAPAAYAPNGPSTGGVGGVPAPGSGGALATAGGATATAGGVPAAGASPSVSGGAMATGGTTSSGSGDFDWPEATADGGGARLCKPGHYVGTYECTVTGPSGAPAAGFLLSGPVDLQLSQSQEGEFLVVNGGTLKSAAGLLQIEAGLSGKLDCQTGKFEATLQNGALSIPPFPPGGTVEGTLHGGFLPASNGLEGTWDLNGGTSFPGYGCTGPWTITWTEE